MHENGSEGSAKARPRLHRVLCGIDFSEGAQLALDYAVPICQAAGAELVLAHVFQPNTYANPGIGGSTKRLALRDRVLLEDELSALRERTVPGRVKARSIVLEGTPYECLPRYAREHEVDLIIVGTTGMTALERLLIGSVAERVVRLSPCPTMVVRPKRKPEITSELGRHGLPEATGRG